VLIAVALLPAARLRAETGYDLWLRYERLTDPIQRGSYRLSLTVDRALVSIVADEQTRS